MLLASPCRAVLQLLRVHHCECPTSQAIYSLGSSLMAGVSRPHRDLPEMPFTAPRARGATGEPGVVVSPQYTALRSATVRIALATVRVSWRKQKESCERKADRRPIHRARGES